MDIVVNGGGLHVAALAYAAQGRHVFPLHFPLARGGRLMCSCGDRRCAANAGKHPYPRLAPKGLVNATIDRRLIDRWWSAGVPYNIAVRTGEPSGIVVVDVDPRHNGHLTLAALENQHGALPPGPRNFTGAGGQHILFRHPGRVVKNNAGALGPGLDIRGDGGYIVVPPSLHITGQRYRARGGDLPLPDMPDWLLAKACDPPAANGHAVAAMPETWRRLVAEGVDLGRRNDAVARLAGHLLRRELDPYVALDLIRCWNAVRCRPPLGEAEIRNTVKSIAAREMRRRAGGEDAGGT
jgi:putative DNA primase/helicase